MQTSTTFFPKQKDIQRKCYLIDANDKVLGRIASRAASILRGKHKPIFTPYLDSGDMVVIINAEKVRVTGKKLTDKLYFRYSGYPSGLKVVTLEQMLKKAPTKVMRLAVNRMIPKGTLGNTVRTRLRVYAGDKHPHQAQNPIPLEI